jgi:hypothetical protein
MTKYKYINLIISWLMTANVVNTAALALYAFAQDRPWLAAVDGLMSLVCFCLAIFNRHLYVKLSCRHTYKPASIFLSLEDPCVALQCSKCQQTDYNTVQYVPSSMTIKEALALIGHGERLDQYHPDKCPFCQADDWRPTTGSRYSQWTCGHCWRSWWCR